MPARRAAGGSRRGHTHTGRAGREGQPTAELLAALFGSRVCLHSSGLYWPHGTTPAKRPAGSVTDLNFGETALSPSFTSKPVSRYDVKIPH